MKARSAKQKGSRLERKVAEEYRRIGIEAKRMPLSGAFSHLKADIFKPVFDGWSDECKNQETVKLKDWWSQTTSVNKQSKPVLHISANHRPIISVIKDTDFDQMMLELEQNGQGFLHKEKVLTKSKFNLWKEWSEIWNSDELGEPIMYIHGYCDDNLVVMQLEHYMEMRFCLL